MKIIKNDQDPELYNEVVAAVEANDGYCCCALVKIPETKCPCKAFRDSTEVGPCDCGRFLKVEDVN